MKISTVVTLLVLSAARGAAAQTTTPIPVEPPAVAAEQTVAGQPADAAAAAVQPASEVRPTLQPPPGSFFKSLGRDLTGFFTVDTAKIMTTFTVAGLAVSHWDRASVEDASEHISSSAFKVGNIGGSLYAQAGAAVGTYVVGRVTNKPKIAELGGDLLRAQIVSQTFVQGIKFVAERRRPDGSNSLSFPSGHSASAFATATVLQEHFGWKAGLPAYAFAGFVGASRMAASKHYMSDVLVGAGIGIAAGRTVTFHLAGEKFALGAAPTQGGAMVTFTRR
jgi:membrane-associated phospholipid phosphatase